MDEEVGCTTESPVLSDSSSSTTGRRICSACWLTVVQFFLLLWKNFILQIRRPVGTIFEILVPICAVAVIVGFRLGLFTAEDRCFVTFESDPLVIPNLNNIQFPYNVYYAPAAGNNSIVQSITAIMAPKIALSGGNLIGVDTEEDFIAAIRNDNLTERFRGCFLEGAAIYFHDPINSTDIEYSIRLRQNPAPSDTWFTDFVSRRFQPRGARIRPNFYLNEGFLHLQKIVDEAIVEHTTGLPVDVNVQVRQFPYPPYRRDIFLTIVDFILPLFVILSFIYSAGVFVKELVLEKETRIRETMKIMGLSNWVLWTSWFTKQFLFYLIPTIIMTLMLRFATVFPKSNPFLVFVYLSMYMLSGISFCFFISVWFSTARIGLMAGFICWFVAYFPYLFIAPNYESISLGPKLGVCIIPNSCVGFGVTVLSILELRQEGLTFSNFATPLSLDDPIHMGWIVLMLAIDTFVYMLLYWYIDAVKPGEYGVPKPFYFPFLPSYWCGVKRSRNIKSEELLGGSDEGFNPEAHEPDPVNIPAGIEIEKLTKIYNQRTLRKRKVAVDRLSLKMYKGQITALLGHNGAGKTTTMSILTGLFPPTSGGAYINGLSVVSDIDIIRRNLGICPQHNVLFDRLTVSEHLHFFARLKGAPSTGISSEVDTLIDDLLLKDKRRVKSMNLSGGMKRKLSVAIALVGGSEVVILDEPTSGMDPYARRATWDLLTKHKEGRTILLTTHFMDEADLLGDRIAIMSEGKLRCSGSSLFLKSRYGVGYHMTMVKGSSCDSGRVTSLVKETVSGAEQVTDVGAELSFLLPAQSTQQFPDLFDILDSRKEELGINSFGVSVTTMEEVFIRVSSGTDEILLDNKRSMSPVQSKPFVRPKENNETAFITDIEDTDNVNETQTAQVVFANDEADEITPAPTPAPPTTGRPSILQLADDTETAIHGAYGTFKSSYVSLNTGFKLWCQQFWAIFLKRFYNSLRFWVAIIWQLIIPLLFVLWGLILGVTNTGFNADDPSRVLTIENSALSDNRTFFYAQFGDSSLFSSRDVDILGLTRYSDMTDIINEMINSTALINSSNINNCCNYKYQLLDKYCASRTMSQLMSGGSVCPSNEGFGYRPCPECLQCCRAKDYSYSISTCTNPYVQDTATRSDTSANAIATDFCPRPPAVSIDEMLNPVPPTGPLDDVNVFVAERLLDLSTEIDVYDFSLRYQGGFVLHSTGPTYATCGCQNDTDETCSFLSYSLSTNSSFNSSSRINSLSELCSALEADQPSCANADWNYNYNYLSDVCSANASCRGVSFDFTQSPAQCSCTDPNQCQIGQTSQAPPPSDSPPTVTVWYNNQPYHMVAAALNGFYNIYLRSRNTNLTVTVHNNPLPRNIDSQITDAQQEFLGFTISSTAVFGLSFLFASFVIFLVQERDTKAKHLQFVSGVYPSSYWLATFCWDLLNSLIPAVLTVILFAAFQIDGYKGENIGAIFLLVLLGCWAAIPVNYVTSFIFSNALVGFCLMLVFFYFGSLIFQVVVFLLVADYPDTSENLSYIFLLHPAYALAIGLANMYTNQGIKNTCEQTPQSRAICEARGIEYADSVFQFLSPGIGHIYLYMALEGVFFLLLAIIIERNFFIPELKRFLFSRNKVDSINDNYNNDMEIQEDSDVVEERNKVNSLKNYSESDAVVIKNLVKEYKDVSATVCSCIPRCREGCKLAVRSINVIIPNGECFGLLGVNGAGKTTTFKILTGDITPSGGTALLNGYNISTQLNEVQQRIGYCPQFDALIERMTGRELLTMFARLRGIPEPAIKGCVQTEIERLDLIKYANKRCGTYSGGNKRKLSTAVSLVGSPPILLLDEPTTGMDPATRRFLWDVLTGIIREGRSVILTSHSMEECEALCTRLAIMVNGQFKCLGSIQHLKSKFGSGYTLQVKVQPLSSESEGVKGFNSRVSFRRSQSREVASPSHSSVNVSYRDTHTVEQFINKTFPGSILLEHHQSSVTYQIPAEGVNWSSLFRKVEENKEQLGIIDYSVSQTTLDQVFINFAKEQEEES
ncbi:PREDICTED: ATP-binding cassette sub-family A member 3-like [Amphimedon queenslandica]|uniref:ABC transporter domain-containing protein n=1 Tax=Amphimedon queenslandica TaxID=400682 RepID=A0A1X7UBY1_AMPQE|nr:PREDICTED: ATP-binding cassette sub-family A member 3-like [Amphimedon queenslandica]|eukprot:XP_019855200.1 PREDICTED: ATP-binding cassette sub-family A member 3-like [Amphimedon queenslandica]